MEASNKSLPVRLDAAILDLEAYVQAHAWVGYDPYDLKAHTLYRRLVASRLTALPAKAMINLFPLAFRRFLNITPQPHPKAMALFARAYLDRYQHTGDPRYRSLAEARLEWLLENPSPGYRGLAWGLPFTFEGRDALPSGVPSVTITAIAAAAFLQAYQTLTDPRYLQAALRIADFFVTEVPRLESHPDRLCFSKAPGLHWHIHNANLMVAAALAKIGQAAGSNQWELLVRRSVNYTLAEQRADGAWYYWGPPDRLLYWIDHYHTGFVLRALDDILVAYEDGSQWEDIALALRRGFDFYNDRLFMEGRIPRYTDRRRFPVDIHGCAEGILCLTQLAGRFPGALEQAQAVAAWTLDHMRSPQGYFYYRLYPMIKIRIPYMRWGQAWMLAALSSLQHNLPAPVSGSTPRKKAVP